MKKYWLVGVCYKTGGVIYENLAILISRKKPSRKQMETIFLRKVRIQNFNMIEGFIAVSLPVSQIRGSTLIELT